MCQGGGVFFRGDRERMVVKNSVLKSHLSCQKADTGHPGTRGLWCSVSGQWPSFSPTSPFQSNSPPTISHLENYSSAAPSHLFFTVILPSVNRPLQHFLYILSVFLSVLGNLPKMTEQLKMFYRRHKTIVFCIQLPTKTGR